MTTIQIEVCDDSLPGSGSRPLFEVFAVSADGSRLCLGASVRRERAEDLGAMWLQHLAATSQVTVAP